ncbi:MAG: nuclear transport factor 2 family protein [Myxococcota bacterium]
MSQRATPHAVVERYFQAMRAGAAAEGPLMALFAEDARYTEPFTGTVRTHVGRAEIRRCFVTSWADPPRDLELTVDRIDVDGTHATAEWTCTSPTFDAPVRGRDEYEIVDGEITALTVVFL